MQHKIIAFFSLKSLEIYGKHSLKGFDMWPVVEVNQQYYTNHTLYLYVIDTEVVGYLLKNAYDLCEVIEVLPDYRLQGIGRSLCKYSSVCKPAFNANPKFWRKIKCL